MRKILFSLLLAVIAVGASAESKLYKLNSKCIYAENGRASDGEVANSPALLISVNAKDNNIKIKFVDKDGHAWNEVPVNREPIIDDDNKTITYMYVNGRDGEAVYFNCPSNQVLYNVIKNGDIIKTWVFLIEL